MDDNDDLLVLTDDEGNDVTLKFVDRIEYRGEEYAVMIPVDEDDDEDAASVVIMRIDEDADGDEAFSSINDDKIMNKVFEIFKTKFSDEYDFE